MWEHLCSSRTLQPRLSRRRYEKCIIALEKTRQILVERRTVSVIATGHELSVKVSSKEPDRNRRNFFVHIALSYSTRWRDCLALLNAGDSVWQFLRQGYITRRGRWVLTDVNTCIRARTSWTLSAVELAASTTLHWKYLFKHDIILLHIIPSILSINAD